MVASPGIKEGSNLKAACPEGFERHGTGCYKALESNASWPEAKVYCSVLGGDLAQIEDDVENTIIMGLISRLHVSKDDEYFWLDGSDILSENEWRWMGQKGASQPMTFTNWRQGQPDNGWASEHCLEIVHDKWNDDKCELLRSFICEA
ncbi:hypothetical protein ACJMK2_009393, partial [Sinanodonta woodiana]